MEGQEEENRAKKDLLKLAEKFLFESKTVDEKVASLRVFAVTLYIGDEEACASASSLLPHIMMLFEEPNVPRHLLHQILGCLSMLANHNEQACRIVLGREKTMLKIIRCIEDVQHVAESRWSCYLLCAMVKTNSELTMDMLQGYPTLQPSLQKASEFSLNWDGWHGNLAQYLLHLLDGNF